MCRLLGYCAAGPVSLAGVMGERGLRAFTGMSACHGDGWGMAWYDGRQPRIERSPQRASDEPAYDKLAHSTLGDLGLVHLRWATPGLPVGPRNTHPFRRGGAVMAHNGAIRPQERLGSLLPPAWERRLAGGTDSERYFLHVLSRLGARSGDMVAALRDTAARIDRMFSANSLNAVFLTPDALHAVCWYDPGSVPRDAPAELAYDGPPERYFDLYYREAAGAVVVASSGWSQDGWVPVPNRHVLVVDRDTMQARVSPLGC